MKSSAVLASLLFGSFAVAAPFDKRALVYKTEVVTETVVIYTTVYEDEVVPEATATPEGLFYEQPEEATSTVVEATSAAYTPPAKVEESSSISTPSETPTPSPAPAYTPEPEQPEEQTIEEAKPSTTEQAKPVTTEEAKPVTTEEAKPVTTEQPAPAAPSSTAVAPAPVPEVPSSPSTGGSTGATYTDVDMTIYDNNGGFGACGTALHDTDMIVALAKDAWGESTYDVMTGEATNKWCGQKIKVDYNGNSIVATIMDLCPGCSGHDIDLSLSAWTTLTGMQEKTRVKASWSPIS